MKKLLLLVLLLLPLWVGAVNFRAYKAAIFKDDELVQERTGINLLITIDLDDDQIKIFGNELITYELARIKTKYTNESGNQVVVWDALSENGARIEIQMLIYKETDGEGCVGALSFTFLGNNVIAYRLRRPN